MTRIIRNPKPSPPKWHMSKAAKRAFTISKEIGLTKEERHELATMLTTVEWDKIRDGFDGSWQDLEEHHFEQLFDYLYGYVLVSTLVAQRNPNLKYKAG